MTRKSQLEKFEARAAKKKADVDAIKKANMKQSANKTTMDKGADMMNTVKPGAKTEDIVAAITHEGMSTFIKMWSNSMENVVKETIRNEVRSIVQEEIQAAVKGVFTGITSAMTMMPELQKLDIDAVLDEEVYREFDTPEHEHVMIKEEAGIDTDGDMKMTIKKPRYSKPRVMHCSVCREKGHNKRNCPNK